MEKTKADVFQTLLLLLITAVLSINAFLFLRIQDHLAEISRQVERIGRAAAPSAAPQAIALGRQAPDFRLPALDGETISLRSFDGRPVLVVFSSITCPACDLAYPAIRDFHRQQGTPDVVMISRGSAEANRRLVREKALEMPILEWRDEVARAYEIPGTPFGVLVDAGGRVASTGVISRPFLDRLAS